MTPDQRRLLQAILMWLIYEWINRYAEPKLAELLRPFAEKLAKRQGDGDLQHYNSRFDSYTQLSGLLATLDGRGNDPHAAAEVEKLPKEHKSEWVLKGPKDPIVSWPLNPKLPDRG